MYTSHFIVFITWIPKRRDINEACCNLGCHQRGKNLLNAYAGNSIINILLVYSSSLYLNTYERMSYCRIIKQTQHTYYIYYNNIILVQKLRIIYYTRAGEMLNVNWVTPFDGHRISTEHKISIAWFLVYKNNENIIICFSYDLLVQKVLFLLGQPSYYVYIIFSVVKYLSN